MQCHRSYLLRNLGGTRQLRPAFSPLPKERVTASTVAIKAERAPTNTMLRSVLTLAACLATTAATAPRPALLQLRGGGGVVEEQPKTGKLWVARSVESSPAPMAGAGPSG